MTPRSSSRDLGWFLTNTLKKPRKIEGKETAAFIDTAQLETLFDGRFAPEAPNTNPLNSHERSVTNNDSRRWPQNLAWFRSFLKIRYESPLVFEALLKNAQDNDRSSFYRNLNTFFRDSTAVNQKVLKNLQQYFESWGNISAQMDKGFGNTAILEAFAIAATQKLGRTDFNLKND